LLPLLQFSFQNPLVPPLTRMLAWLNDTIQPLNPFPQYIGSMAIALILVATLIKLVTYPLSLTQMRSMRKMQQLQPEIAELQQKHKGDREKLGQAQMELYREKGVNPFGGCLPLVITMVVLISMYGAINALKGEMAGQPFLWIPNIGDCEANPGCQHLPVLPVGVPILLLVMVASQFLYQKYMTPPSADPSAQAMNASMKFMPLLFGFFFISVPAGLVLYYLVFNVVSILQQLLMNRHLGPPSMMLPVPVSDEKGARAGPEPGAMPPKEQGSDERGDRRRRRKKNA
jgi:YidC/Oxa1 family membrane protein insertase